MWVLMKALILFLGLFSSLNAFSRDLTSQYYKYFSMNNRLSPKELTDLGKRDIILVPGLFSEIVTWEDPRGNVDFSILTSDYFGIQLKHLKKTLKLSVQKIHSSSKDINETKVLIANAINHSRKNKRKVLFMAHSMGSLALLDYLLEANQDDRDNIDGIIFLQPPFYGSPIADLIIQNPSLLNNIFKPLFIFLNSSIETLTNLTVASRTKYMQDNFDRIHHVLSPIPTVTLASMNIGRDSLFSAGEDIIKHGCAVNTLGVCISRTIWTGKRGRNDGLVPLSSTMLESADQIIIENIDHAEPVVRLPFNNIRREDMTETLFKVLLDKMRL